MRSTLKAKVLAKFKIILQNLLSFQLFGDNNELNTAEHKKLMIYTAKINSIVFWVLALIICIVHVSYVLYPCITYSFDLSHDGTHFLPAFHVAEGKTLFRDTADYYSSPLSVWLNALALFLFGKQLIMMKLFISVACVASGFVLYNIWTRIIPPLLAFLTLIFFLALNGCILPWPQYYLLFFTSLTMFLLVRWLNSQNRWELFFAGLLSGLTILSRMTGGLQVLAVFVLFLAVVVFILPKEKRSRREQLTHGLNSLGLFLLGTGIILSFFFIWLVVNGALNDWYIQTFKFADIFVFRAFNIGGSQSFAGRVLFTLKTVFFVFFQKAGAGGTLSYLLFALLSLLCIVDTFGQIASRKRPSTEQLTALLMSLMVIFSSNQGRGDGFFFHFGFAPAYGLLGYYLYVILNSLHIYIRGIVVALFIWFIFSIPIFPASTPKGYIDHLEMSIRGGLLSPIKNKDIIVPEVLRGLRRTGPEIQFWKKLSQELNDYMVDHQNIRLLTMTKSPIYATLLKGKTPFHTFHVLNGFTDGPYPALNASLYPDFWEKWEKHVRDDRPLIIADQYNIGFVRHHIIDYEVIFEWGDFPWDNPYHVWILAPRENSQSLPAGTSLFDYKTVGNWKGKYGRKGYVIASDETLIPASISSLKFKDADAAPIVFGYPKDDYRALERVAADGRIAAAITSSDRFEVVIAATEKIRMTLYFLSFDHQFRKQRVQLLDGRSGEVLDEYEVEYFDQGVYRSWDIERDIVVRVIKESGDRVMISGIFFD